MCKCCQSLWESCYWHCCEKHFCWDDSIALYEDPEEKKSEQNNNGLDNMAFYDNVALIANRAIFTIEPLPPKEPIVTQPKKKLRWFEDPDEEETSTTTQKVIEDEIDNRINIKGRKMSVVPEEDSDTVSVDTVETTEEKKERKLAIANAIKMADNGVELRRKKLQDRRMSKGLTLIINRPELPVIRHNSMPKFYLDTPEENQLCYNGARTPSVTLTAPIKPKEFEFDLRSVVQIQKETKTSTENSNSNKPKRTQSVKERILKRQTSNSSSSNRSSIASVHM